MNTTIAAVAAGATIASAIFIFFQVREMKRQTAIQREISEASAAPYVWADVRIAPANGLTLEFVVGNSGRTVARNVVVAIDPPLPAGDRHEARFVEVMQQKLLHGLSSVAPGRTFTWTLGRSPDLVNREGSLAHTITIDCEGPAGPVPRSEYVIDFSGFRESTARHDGTMNQIAKAITQAGEKLASEQKRQTALLGRLPPLPEDREVDE